MMYAAAGKNGIDLCPICCRQKHTDNNDRNRKRRKRYRGDHEVRRTPQNLLRGKGKRGDDTDHTNPLVGSAQTARKQAARPKACRTGDQNACGGAIPARLRQCRTDVNGNIGNLIIGHRHPCLLLHHGNRMPCDLHELRMFFLHLREQRIADIHVEFQTMQCRGKVIHEPREQRTAAHERRAALFGGAPHDRLCNLHQPEIIHAPAPRGERHAACTEQMHGDIADLRCRDGNGEYLPHPRRNRLCHRKFFCLPQLLQRPRIHRNRITLLQPPHGEREMDDKPDACAVWDVTILRLRCNSVINAADLRGINEAEQGSIRRVRQSLLSRIVSNESKEFLFIHIIVDDANQCTADIPLRPFDVDAESGTAHERDLLCGKPRLQTIEIMTDGTVGHVQKMCQSKELERLIRHEKTCDQDGTPLIGGQCAVHIRQRKLRTQMPKRCGIPTEHESRTRAPKEHHAIGLQCRLDPVHLARHSTCADTELCGDMFGSHIAGRGKKQRQYRPHTCR